MSSYDGLKILKKLLSLKKIKIFNGVHFLFYLFILLLLDGLSRNTFFLKLFSVLKFASLKPSVEVLIIIYKLCFVLSRLNELL